MSRQSPARRPNALNISKINCKRSAFTPMTNGVFSPVTDLAINLKELSTRNGGCTPKRRLALSDMETETPAVSQGIRPKALEKQFSQDSGVSMDSPSPTDPECIPSRSYFKSSALNRFQSMPAPFFELDSPKSHTQDDLAEDIDCEDNDSVASFTFGSPRRVSPTPIIPGTTDDNASPGMIDFTSSPKMPTPTTSGLVSDVDEESSRDGGVCLDQESRDKQLETDFRFVEPVGPAPRRSRVLSEEMKSPRSPLRQLSLNRPSKSVPMLSFSPFMDEQSPVKLRRSSLTSSNAEDDGFLDFDVDDIDGKSQDLPTSMSTLFTAPLINSPNGSTPVFRKSHITRLFSESDDLNSSLNDLCSKENKPLLSSRRGLFKSPSAPRLCQRTTSSKRSSEPCSAGETTPTFIKRRKSVIESPLVRQEPELDVRPRLQRCHSATEASIKSALSRIEDDPNMIGDCSRTFCLPSIPGKHSDLKSITADTLAKVINNEYDSTIERAIIVDCRYPYEYEGGHIKGAINLYTHREILEEFIQDDGHLKYQSKDSNKRTVLVFHCEFSSERGPRMSRFLRNMDRDQNKESYPHLHYPEMYLLHNGYKEFFHTHKELCVPEEYKPMLHEDHTEDYKTFRAKTKSSEGRAKKLLSKSKSWAGDRPRVPLRSGLKGLL